MKSNLLQTLRRRAALPASVLALALAFASPGRSTTIDWLGGTSVTWADALNWSGGIPTDDVTTDIARFNQTSYSFQPTAPSNRAINGLIFGDGSTSTAAVTITTGTSANRLIIGGNGIIMHANSGAATIGAGASQGVTLGASQTWTNDSSSQLRVRAVANEANLTPFLLTLAGSGTGLTLIDAVIANGGTTGTTAIRVNRSAGAVTLSGINTFTGGLTLDAGTLNLGNDAALGGATNVFTIAGGSIDVSAARLTTNNNAQNWNGDFTFVGTNTWNTGTGPVTMNASRAVTVSASTMTVGGAIGGVGFGLTKSGAGTLALAGANTYDGATTVTAGTLTLNGAGSILNSTGVNVTMTSGSTPVLTLDNGALASINRIGNAVPVTFSNGGTFNWTHAAGAGIGYAETVGGLSVNGGQFTLNASQAEATGTSAMTYASLTRSGGASFKFAGAGLGENTRNQLFFTAAPTEVNSVIPGAVLDRAGVFDLVDYDATAGIRATSAAGAYITTAPDPAWGATVNARPSADILITGNKNLNSLILDDTIDLSAPATDRRITFSAGATILQTGGSSVIRATTTFENILAFGANQAHFHTVGELIFNRGDRAAPNGNLEGSGGLVKSGAGNLVLNINSIMTGDHYINEGTLVPTRAGSLGGNVVELNGGTLHLAGAGNADTDFGSNVRINGSRVLGRINVSGAYNDADQEDGTHTLGVLTLGTSTQAQTIQVRTVAAGPTGAFFSGNDVWRLTFDAVTLAGNGTFDVADRGTSEGLITVTGPIDDGAGGPAAFTLDKVTGGTLVLGSATNNWTGATTVSGGAIRLNAGANLGGGNLSLQGGLLEIDSANFTRALGTGSGEVRLPSGVSGFSARGTGAIVSLGGIGTPTALTWGSATFNPSELQLSGTEANAVLTFANSIDLAGATAATERAIGTDGANDIDFWAKITGNLTGTGSLLKTGAGILELAGTNSYTGVTRVGEGHLRVIAASVLAAGNLSLNPGGTNAYAVLETAGDFTRSLGSAAGEVLMVSTSTTDGRAGFSAVGGNLRVNLGNAGATLVWNTTNFDPNGTSTNSSGLQLQSLSATGVLTFENGIDLNSNSSTDASLWRRIGGASTTVATRAVITGNIVDTGATAGSSGLQKREGSLLVLAPTTGSNTYSGATQVGAGTLAAVDGVGIPSGNLSLLPFTTNNRPTFAPMSATFTRALGTGSNQVQLLSPGAITGSESGFTAWGQDVAVNLGGAGAEVQWGTATFSPSVFLLNDTIGTHKLTFENDLDLNSATARTISVRATDPAGIAEISGDIQNTGGVGGLTKTNVGLLVLSGTNIYTGVNTITGGTLQVNRATDGMGDSTAVSAINLNGGTLSLRNNGAGNDGTVIYGSTSNATGYNVQLSASSTINVGNLTANTGNTMRLGPLTQATAAVRTLTVTGANGYSLTLPSLGLSPALGQNTTLNPTTASLIIAGNVTNPMSGFTAANFDTLTLGGTSTGNRIDGSITDAAGGSIAAGGTTRVTKSDSSTWTLNGTGSYKGVTTVSGGTLLINGDHSMATGNVTVDAGATLGGYGTIGGATTISGIHSPGNSPGIQPFLSDLTYSGGASVVNWELLGNTTTNAANPNAVYDQLVVGGDLNFAGATTLNLSFNGMGSNVDWSNTLWESPQSWLLYDVTGMTSNLMNFSIVTSNWLDGQGDLFETVLMGSSFSLRQDGQDVYIDYIAIPEPSRAMLLLLGLLSLGFRRRRGV